MEGSKFAEPASMEATRTTDPSHIDMRLGFHETNGCLEALSVFLFAFCLLVVLKPVTLSACRLMSSFFDGSSRAWCRL